MRLWFLRRAVPWPALIGCCAVAALAAAALHPWPGAAWGVVPLVLAACAAGSGFVFDDLASSVTSVTPRGRSWGPSTRSAAALVPLSVFTIFVVTAPSDLRLDRSDWLLPGFASVAAATGVAALCARRQVARPGPGVAGAVALVVLAPMVAGPFLGSESIFPWEGSPGWLLASWGTVAAAGVLLGVVGCLPATRHPGRRGHRA